MSKPIVFLDCDGVLNSLESLLAFGTYAHFDPVAVGLVERLCRTAGAMIVVSSSWRVGGGMETLKRNLSEAGAEKLLPLIFDMTSWHDRREKRGEEIADWLARKPHRDRYVILDDDSDMLPEQPFVQTTMGHGFGLGEYVKALEFLLPGHRECSDFKPYVGRLAGMRQLAGTF